MRKKKLCIGLGLLAAFAAWTAAVCVVDVQSIGPEGSAVGFATMNRWAHDLTGVNWTLYIATDWLGLVPLAVVLGFGLLGLCQWVWRKNILRVDRSILVLGGFYVAVFAVFLVFEELAVNYRPVLIEGVLEASYPSSTTMLTLCVMPTAALQLRSRIGERKLRRWLNGVIWAFTAFMVAGRLLSGVHWLSDIVGGGLFSAGVVTLYSSVTAEKVNSSAMA